MITTLFDWSHIWKEKSLEKGSNTRIRKLGLFWQQKYRFRRTKFQSYTIPVNHFSIVKWCGMYQFFCSYIYDSWCLSLHYGNNIAISSLSRKYRKLAKSNSTRKHPPKGCWITNRSNCWVKSSGFRYEGILVLHCCPRIYHHLIRCMSTNIRIHRCRDGNSWCCFFHACSAILDELKRYMHQFVNTMIFTTSWEDYQ